MLAHNRSILDFTTKTIDRVVEVVHLVVVVSTFILDSGCDVVESSRDVVLLISSSSGIVVSFVLMDISRKNRYQEEAFEAESAN